MGDLWLIWGRAVSEWNLLFLCLNFLDYSIIYNNNDGGAAYLVEADVLVQVALQPAHLVLEPSQLRWDLLACR